MLSPQSRTLLRDALRPLPGYRLDRALITTYSLDLMALLTVPLAFTFFDLKDQDGPLKADPLALIEALRRHARQLTIFCQEGQIHLPRNVQLMFGYLEDRVVQVTSPRRNGVFHPKLSVLRYVADAEPTDVTYRLLCASRNLTFDRSWDTLLLLDGKLSARRRNAYAANRPLAHFIRSLPALRPKHAPILPLPHVAEIADELLRVEFKPPEGFVEMAFCPIGITGAENWPFDGAKRMAVVSPFVSNGFVTQLAGNGREVRLVSRRQSLDELSLPSLKKLTKCHYLNDGAEQPASSEDATETPPPPPGDSVTVEPSHQLSGLHAKLFVADDGHHAKVWTGSANATTAAFEKNVEFLVRLSGSKARCGVDALMGLDDEAADGVAKHDRIVTFARMLVPYERSGEAIIDTGMKIMEAAVDRARSAILAAGLRATVEVLTGEPTRYRLTLAATTQAAVSWPASVSVECGLITMKEGFRALSSPVPDPMMVLEPLSFEALTSFIAFRLQARVDGEPPLSCGFVLNVPITGLPADREGRILLSLLRNRQQLLRYLLMLLADDEDAAARIAELLSNDTARSARDSDNDFGLPLLEPLLQTLDRHPERLAQIQRLIGDLQMTAEGSRLVSGDFLDIWNPIWAAAQMRTATRTAEVSYE